MRLAGGRCPLSGCFWQAAKQLVTAIDTGGADNGKKQQCDSVHIRAYPPCFLESKAIGLPDVKPKKTLACPERSHGNENRLVADINHRGTNSARQTLTEPRL